MIARKCLNDMMTDGGGQCEDIMIWFKYGTVYIWQEGRFYIHVPCAGNATHQSGHLMMINKQAIDTR